MKQQLIYLCTATFLLIGSTQAQTALNNGETPKIHTSKPFDTQGTTLYYVPKSYITTTSNLVAVIPVGAVWHKSFSVEYFDLETGELISVHEEDMGDRNVFVESTHLINERLFVFYSEYDKVSNQEFFFAREILYHEPGKLGDEYKLIATRGKVRTNSEFNYAKTGSIAFTNSGKFIVYPAKDKKSFIVKYSMLPNEKIDGRSAEEIGLAVFDSEMQNEWEKVITMPHIESELEIKNILLGSDMSAYLLLKHQPKSSSEGNKISVLQVAEEIKSFQLDTKGIYVEDVQFAQHKNNDIYLAGYYRPKAKAYIIGTFTSILHPDGLFQPLKTQLFDFETIVQYQSISDAQREKIKAAYNAGEYGLFHLKAQSLDFLADESVLLTGHRYQSTTSVHETGSFDIGKTGDVARGSQAYSAIWMIKFTPEMLETEWQSRVPINTEWPVTYDAQNDFFINKSYRMLLSDNQAVFVLPESSKNTTIDNNQDVEKEIAPYNSVSIYQVDLESGDKTRYVFATDNAVGTQKAKNFSPERVALNGQRNVFIELTGDKKTSNMYLIHLK